MKNFNDSTDVYSPVEKFLMIALSILSIGVTIFTILCSIEILQRIGAI